MLETRRKLLVTASKD
ncbi:hypothetical protein LINPERPRIM_LOCUS6192 [Linum perenne]